MKKQLKALFASSVAAIGLAACGTVPTAGNDTELVIIPGAPNTPPSAVQPASPVQPFEDHSGMMLRNQLRLECLKEFNQHKGNRGYRYRGECSDFFETYPRYLRNFNDCYDPVNAWSPACRDPYNFQRPPRVRPH